ncbi:MAG: hypothetical protein Harvfovirus23_4 [Harvfovirus sp.]|uniref:Uncharacterized protein n=1 Tax=Harvfovirus sp. TaxID=2487768 RepID=A0A3G5A230_9VIRU|nr:MAG: hypothetical protein Harvfovirus23_4 [Harvfovirus sp.]
MLDRSLLFSHAASALCPYEIMLLQSGCCVISYNRSLKIFRCAITICRNRNMMRSTARGEHSVPYGIRLLQSGCRVISYNRSLKILGRAITICRNRNMMRSTARGERSEPLWDYAFAE